MRAKSYAALNVIEQKALSPKAPQILADEMVVLTNHQKAKRKNHYTETLRRI